MADFTEQQMADAEDRMTPESQVERKEQLKQVYDVFVKRRDKWVAYRASSGVETSWRKWEKLYTGTYEDDTTGNSMMDVARNGPSMRTPGTANRSKLSINIVRPKVDQSVARHAEILLPTDDKNWGIYHTPSPELAEIANDTESQDIDANTGQPMAATAQSIIDRASKAAELMSVEIDDVLAACNYNGACREALTQGVKLGTGIIKGPFPVIRRSKSWSPGPDGVATMNHTQKIDPASKHVSVWNIYPDPSCGNDIHRGSGLFEKRPINRKELRALIGVPGYDEAAIREVLGQEPSRISAASNGKLSRNQSSDDMYELWEYHGEIEEDDMYTLTAEQDKPLEVGYGMLAIVNDVIIGAMESYNPEACIPYDAWVYREDDESPFGIGLPDELEHQQRAVTGAWRQLMDNASAAAGYHVILKKGAVSPVGGRQGSYELSSRMVWEANEEVEDIRTVFNVVTIDMRAQELLSIVSAAMQFADQETSMPQLLGGEKGNSPPPETLGGMQILQGNAQGPLRFRIKRWDDKVTKGQIPRHYDWQMEYSKKADIKGDFEVEARGATYLLDRDITAQATLQMDAISNNPRYIPHLDTRKELEERLRAMHIDPGMVTKPIEQVDAEAKEAAKQPPPQDPRIAAAEMNLQAKQMDLQDADKQRQFEAARNQQEMAHASEQLQYNRLREESEREIALTDNAIERETTLLKLDTSTALSRETLASRERLEAIKIDNETAKFNAEMDVKVRQGSGI